MNRFKRAQRHVLMLFVVVMFVLVIGIIPAFAQTPTMVPLEIPVNVVLSSTNTWMNTFAPILAIGTGIAIAIAVLTLFGDKIIAGLRGGGRR